MKTMTNHIQEICENYSTKVQQMQDNGIDTTITMSAEEVEKVSKRTAENKTTQTKKVAAIDKIRSIVRWCDWENEHINYMFRSISDIEIAYDFCESKDVEFVSSLSSKERKELSQKLGYEV